jgi:hypothetical protein
MSRKVNIYRVSLIFTSYQQMHKLKIKRWSGDLAAHFTGKNILL